MNMKSVVDNARRVADPEQTLEENVAQQRATAVQAARSRPAWIEFQPDELASHRGYFLDDRADRVLERARGVWVGGDPRRGSSEEDVVAWFLSPADGFPVLLRRAQTGPKSASAYRAVMARNQNKSGSLAEPSGEVGRAAEQSGLRRGGWKRFLVSEADKRLLNVQRRAADVRSARVDVARSIESWVEITPAERLVNRGPFLVDAETDYIYTRRRGNVWEDGKATLSFLTPQATELAFYVDADEQVVFLERHTGAATWSEVVARQTRRGTLRAVS